MNIADRLKVFLDQKGINNRDADQRFGFSNGLTGKFLTGKTNLGIDKVEEILKVFPELSADWLIRGREPMYISTLTLPQTLPEGFDLPNITELRVPYKPGHYHQVIGRATRIEEKVEELQQRLNDKEETIIALKETVNAYRKLVEK